MLLAIDVGNTNIVIGCLDGEEIRFTERLSTDTGKTSLEYAILFRTALDVHRIDPESVDGAVIASVVPLITPVIQTALHKITGIRAMVLGPGVRTGLNIRIDDPSTAGADLIAGAVGALAQYDPPLVVVDMGTATTLSVIGADGSFQGGIILPGLRLGLNALVNGTSMLQSITLRVPEKVIGKNTPDAMCSGIVLGHAEMIDGLIDRVEKELGQKVTVVGTGGLMGVVQPAMRHEVHRDKGLLLTGLRVIYERSRAHRGPEKGQKGEEE